MDCTLALLPCLDPLSVVANFALLAAQVVPLLGPWGLLVLSSLLGAWFWWGWWRGQA